MFVKNNCARLIVINDGEKSFEIIPGVNQSVKISDAAAKLSFTQGLLASGDLLEVAGKKEAPSAEPEPTDELDRDAIIQQLTELGVEFNKSAQVKTLKKLLDEALMS